MARYFVQNIQRMGLQPDNAWIQRIEGLQMSLLHCMTYNFSKTQFDDLHMWPRPPDKALHNLMQYYDEFQQSQTESNETMDEFDTRGKFFKGLNLKMLENQWLNRLRDEHSYMTTTPLQSRDTCQRIIVNMILIGGLTIELKASPMLKAKKNFSKV